MNVKKTFEAFCKKIHLDNTSKFDTSIEEITKKLNKKYYSVDRDTAPHQLTVGSIGRKTAVENVSDVDIIFSLPDEIYKKYDNYKGNGQSALLQEVKNELLTRYPNTEIHGDGQVVSIEFSDYTIELVPGFHQSDDSYKYPDSNDGGSWKITNPIPEQKASKKKADDTDDNYIHMCNILRAWKNNIGFPFKGLLIDTLVFNYFSEHLGFANSDFGRYIDFLIDMWLYLSQENPEQSYWYALGSNQKIYNSDKGIFVKKASIAHRKLSAAQTEEEQEKILKDLLGRDFSHSIINEKSSNANASYSNHYGSMNDVAPNEQFIEELFPVDIKWNLQIDCQITQKGFRTFWLSAWGRRSKWLSKDKSLKFQIMDTDVPEPYQVYWKIRNCGPEAIRRNNERGEIVKGEKTKIEHTQFSGEHYAECYIIKHSVCVARSKVSVPINTTAVP